jgi:extracellular elastinolytic metalloproteinase
MDVTLSLVERFLGPAGAGVQLDPHVQTTSGGDRIVHGQQQFRGLSLYPHSMTFTVKPEGEVAAGGDPLLDPVATDVVPDLAAAEAVRLAVRHLRQGGGTLCHTPHDPQLLGRRYVPRLLSAFPMVNRPTVFTKGPFHEPVQSNLVLHRAGETLTLAWLVMMALDGVADFAVVIGAAGERSRELLACAAESASAVCRAAVYLFSPADGPPVTIDFPRPPGDYPPSIRPGNPFRDWIDADALAGNNVEMLLRNKTPNLRTLAGSDPARFQAARGSDDELLVNAFFLCNFAHDLFLLLGFDEAHGNFQRINFSGRASEATGSS